MNIYHVGMSRINWFEVKTYLTEIGASNWEPETGGGEALTELAGRLCYRSFAPKLNPNVEKIRDGNKAYIGNLLNQHHGSVLEHCVDSFIVTGVSRVCTHEIVRHRHLSISQESLRYVRIEELDLVEPGEVQNRAAWDIARFGINKIYQQLLYVIQWPANFAAKKALTSALRRLIPMGQKTSLMLTANARAWRWMIEARTSEGAEEEIRKLFLEIFKQLALSYPNIYQDAEVTEGGTVAFKNSKV